MYNPLENSSWHTSLIMMALSFAFIDVPLWLYLFYPLNLQTFSFESTDFLLWFNWTFPLLLVKRRALNEMIASARHRNAERSATSWIQRSGSVNPQKPPSNSPEGEGRTWRDGGEIHLRLEFLYSLQWIIRYLPRPRNRHHRHWVRRCSREMGRLLGVAK